MRRQKTKICIVEDDRFYARLVENQLDSNRWREVEVFNSGDEFFEHMDQDTDVVVLDYQLGETNGLDILCSLKRSNPDIQVIFLSAQERMSVAVEALKKGAYDYLEKSDEGLMRLSQSVNRISKLNDVMAENRVYQRLQYGFFSVLTLFFITLGFLAVTGTRIF